MALIVVISLLLSGTILPVAATSISDIVGSSGNPILDDDSIKDDNLIISYSLIPLLQVLLPVNLPVL